METHCPRIGSADAAETKGGCRVSNFGQFDRERYPSRVLHQLLGSSPALAAVREELARLFARLKASPKRLPPVNPDLRLVQDLLAG